MIIRVSCVIELVSKRQGYRDPQKPPEHKIVQEAEAFSSFTFGVASEANEFFSAIFLQDTLY